MSRLSMVEAKLPPGFRFHPRDEELVCDYLATKLASSDQLSSLLIEVDLNKCEPWDIPEAAHVGGKEWYFYSQRDRKYATGQRTNRATSSGYWKATGKDRQVMRQRTLVGMRKTLVFYRGRAPKGRKTDWVMHEFRLEGPVGPPKEDWVLCRVFHKNTREVGGAKQSMGRSTIHGEAATSSSSLPPLMDCYISFDQTLETMMKTSNSNTNNEFEYYEDDGHVEDDDDGDEHVPCFSTTFNPSFPHLVDPMLMPAAASCNSFGNDHEMDPKVIRNVLDHLSNIKASSSSGFGDGGGGGFFSDMPNLPAFWNHYY